jgi:CRISPR-associated protein Cmr2
MSFDYFVKPERQHFEDSFVTRYHMLVAKDEKNKADNLRSEWARGRLKVDLKPLPDTLKLPPIDLSQLPLGAFFVQFKFKLLKPYISRDDNQFYILDNPIVREKVFRCPMARATAWKGSLRHALWQLGYQEDDEEDKGKQIRRLFGTANDDKPEQGKGGRLYFYPTFFTETSLEVINPHDRERRVGKNPILMESVPTDAEGTFTLLYVPLDRIGNEKSDPAQSQKSLPDEVVEDLALVATGIEEMLTVCGFGAKTSSGFGLAELDGEGRLAIHYPEAKAQQPRPQEPAYPEIVQQFLADYPAEYLDMKPRQLKEAGVPNLMRQQVREIKALHQQYHQELAQHQAQLAAWEATAVAPPAPVTIRPFASFTHLSEIVANLPGFEEEKQ